MAFTADYEKINRSKRLDVKGDSASMNLWGLRQAAAMWDGLGGVSVGMSRGYDRNAGFTSVEERNPGIYNNILGGMWAGVATLMEDASGALAFLNPAARYMSSRDRRTVAAHEIGHTLGLPHAMATGANSIMNYNTMFRNGGPTSADAAAMTSIYGGKGNLSSPPQDEPSNPFDGLIDGLMKKLKDQFPGAGMFVDAAGGLAKTGIGQVVKWISDIKEGIKNIAGNVVDSIKDFFGGGAAVAPDGGPAGMAPTLMDGGGWLRDTDGPTVIHQKKKPDAFTPFDEWQQMKADYASSRAGNGDTWNVQLPEKASVNDLMDAVSFQQRRNARVGARR